MRSGINISIKDKGLSNMRAYCWIGLSVGTALLFALIMTSACSSAQPFHGDPCYPEPTVASVKDIYSGKLNDKLVKIAGRYQGWAGCAAQQNNTIMVTRSDWVLSDASGCIYVTGGIPRSVKPLPNHPEGQKVCIIAVAREINGKHVLVFRQECAYKPFPR